MISAVSSSWRMASEAGPKIASILIAKLVPPQYGKSGKFRDRGSGAWFLLANRPYVETQRLGPRTKSQGLRSQGFTLNPKP